MMYRNPLMNDLIDPKFEGSHEWMQTFTGRAFWALNPKAEDIHIQDIAHGLSNICRYNGQCANFYSVAEHSVLLYQALPPEFRFWGLMHDASEAYICDVPRPYKHALTNYKEIEERIMRVIADKYGMPWPMPDAVKALDSQIIINEKAALFKTEPAPWRIRGESIPKLEIHCWPPSTAKAQFLSAFAECVTI